MQLLFTAIVNVVVIIDIVVVVALAAPLPSQVYYGSQEVPS